MRNLCERPDGEKVHRMFKKENRPGKESRDENVKFGQGGSSHLTEGLVDHEFTTYMW